MQEIVIIGAGPAGLSTAYHLNGPAWMILEQHDRIGGLCQSIEDNGFTFDYAGHIMFTNSDYIKDVMYPKLLGDNVHWQDREAWVYSKGTYTRYPFQASTYGLPPEVIKECILGAVKASYEQAINLGVNSTPTFFINGEKVTGYQTFEQLQQRIDAELSK